MSRSVTEVFVGLLIVAIPLIGLARRWLIPYPIALVLGGLALGFVPGLPAISLDPDLVLLIFLPPLLYWQSVTAPIGEMRANKAWILALALGLVIATTIVVAAVAHAIAPQMGWGAAFVLGAVVAPTDEIAVAPIAARLGLPRDVLAIIEGESLGNDAASLVIYSAGVAAVVTGVFSWRTAFTDFVIAGVGAIAVGIAAGILAIAAWRLFKDTRVQTVVAVALPFVAYVPAQYSNVSGVLAVVTAGVLAGRYNPMVVTPTTRLQIAGFWQTTVFLVNTVVFILVGLTLHGVVAKALEHGHPWSQLLLITLFVNVAIIAVRCIWVFGQGGIRMAVGRAPRDPSEWKRLTMIAFCGFRGAISLAAALAIPVMTTHGEFPERDLLIFTTFSVILVTLVGGGLTLPAVVKALHLAPNDRVTADVRRALIALNGAALEQLEQLEVEHRIEAQHARAVRERFVTQQELLSATDVEAERRTQVRFDVERELIAARRRKLVQLHKGRAIDGEVLRRLQRTLDRQEDEIERAAADLKNFSEGGDEVDAPPTLGLADAEAVMTPPAATDPSGAP
jgi:CPA1 family monovalent cation:H+ antiporter